MVELSLSLVGGNQDVIPFSEGSGYVLTSGLRGLGIPSTDVRITPSAGDGGTWRSTRRGIREIDLPIMVLGTSRRDLEIKLRRLASALSDRQGMPYLRATYSDGEGPYDIEIHYTAGAETVFGEDASDLYCRWVITVQSPEPYWTSVDSESFALGSNGVVRGLLPNLQQLQVSSSQVIGELVIENPGDVEAFPTWTFRGPMDSVTVTAPDGRSFSYDENITASETITVDTKRGTVTDQTGANKYGNLAPSPKLFPIPAGRSRLDVVATGTSPGVGGIGASLITCSYKPRREVIH